ncbi:hypothetical protein B0H14DRAFT_2559865 [Mycena olivaceomarginata]|nr:hypothetical protein B0H14DRAFT_2559865 [Mycena olivaceomarginata]
MASTAVRMWEYIRQKAYRDSGSRFINARSEFEWKSVKLAIISAYIQESPVTWCAVSAGVGADRRFQMHAHTINETAGSLRSPRQPTAKVISTSRFDANTSSRYFVETSGSKNMAKWTYM